ncbi:MAG TPA: hypothetical protein VNI77_08905 [Nitrososphaera sp.]|nr:hypothetical protein [Nitrososphaera sp.]
MEQLTQPADALITFCKDVISRYKENWPPSEGKLAEEFATYFSHDFAGLEALLSICNKLEIQVSIEPLPEGLHGINGNYGAKREITLAKEEAFPGGKEHTLLHELRELIEYEFCELGFPTLQYSGKEVRADQFASHVRANEGMKLWKFMFDELRRVEANWKRKLGYAFVLVFCFVHQASCLLHPQLEDAIKRATIRR